MELTTAYEDPTTRQAWRRTALFRLGMFLFAGALGVGWLYSVVLSPWTWTLWLLMPVLLVLIYFGLWATAMLVGTRRIRRILTVYPWQSCPDAARTAKNGTTRFDLANPDQPDKSISVRTGDWLGSGFTFWVRQVGAGAVSEVWFAGDPRFFGVVATPGPRRLLGTMQREAGDHRMSPRRRGVSPEARERARAVGARVG